METFVFDLKRDACSAVRGFVYQVERTIQAWLELEVGRTLQLEAGEDIDEILGHLQRTSTQVKHLTGTITLSEAAPFLANSLESRRMNPAWRVSARFLTTALPGFEHGRPFGPDVKGIEAWIEAQSTSSVLEAAGFIQRLRAFLTGLRRTKAYTESGWQAFEAFVKAASDLDLFDLVKSIEWQVGSAGRADLESTLLKRLGERGMADEDRLACFHRLFHYVFDRLSQEGPKFLTSEELDELLQGPVGTAEAASIRTLNQRLLEFNLCIGELEGRLEQVERRMAPVEDLVAAASPLLATFGSNSQRGGLADSMGARALAALVAELGDTQPPVLGDDWIETANLKAALGLASISTWLNVFGGVGSGKSTLARQIADSSTGRILWVRLSASDQSSRIDAFRAFLAGCFGASWSEALTSLASGSVIVLDDVRLYERPVADRVGRLAIACDPLGIRLVTTSTRPLHSSVPKGVCAEYVMLPWCAEDIRSFVASTIYNDESNLGPLCSLLAAVTRGLPTLIRFADREILQKGETLDRRLFEQLLQLPMSSTLTDETAERLVAELDIEARTLLYRLAVPILPFSDKYVREVACVDAVINDPIAAKVRLLNGWLERRNDDLTTSPLVKGFESQLAPEMLRHCHGLAALDLHRRETNTPLQAVASISHLTLAGDGEMAVADTCRLLANLSAADGEPTETFGPLILSLPVPKVAARQEIILRAQRASLLRQLGRNEEAELDRVSELALLLSEEDSPSAFAAYAGLQLGDVRAAFSTRAILFRLGMRGSAELRPLELECMLLITLARAIRTVEDAETFVRIAGEIPIERLIDSNELRDGELLRESFDSIWLFEANKTEAERDWPQMLAILRRLFEGAKELSASSLAAVVARTQAIVLSEYLGRTDEAIACLDALTNETWVTAEDRWFVDTSAGIQLLYTGHIESGTRRLLEYLDPAPASKHLRLQYSARMELMRHLVKSTTVGALRQINAARSLTLSDCFSDHDRFRCEAEQMLIEWATNGIAASWRYADAAGRLLVGAESTEAIRVDFVRFGHAITYISVEHISGKPPALIANGEPFEAPFVGMFGGDGSNLSTLDSPLKRAFVARQMMELSGALGDVQAEVWWVGILEQGLTLPGGEKLMSLISPIVERVKLQKGDFSGALNMFSRALRCQVALTAARQAGECPEQFEGFDVDLWLSRATREQRLDTALYLFRFVILVCGCLLAGKIVRGEEVACWVELLSKEVAAVDLLDVLEEPRTEFLRFLSICGLSRESQEFFLFGESKKEGGLGIICCARLLASVQPDCELKRAHALQVSIENYITQDINRLDEAGLDQVFTSLLADFWRRRLEADSFRFRSPRFALQWLDDASETGLRNTRPARILESMKMALGS